MEREDADRLHCVIARIASYECIACEAHTLAATVGTGCHLDPAALKHANEVEPACLPSTAQPIQVDPRAFEPLRATVAFATGAALAATPPR